MNVFVVQDKRSEMTFQPVTCLNEAAGWRERTKGGRRRRNSAKEELDCRNKKQKGVIWKWNGAQRKMEG